MKYKCVCCGYNTLYCENELEHEICPVCFWENDPIQNNDPDYEGGANYLSLNQAKENYKKYGAISPKHLQYVRFPKGDEKSTD